MLVASFPWLSSAHTARTVGAPHTVKRGFWVRGVLGAGRRAMPP